MPHFNSIWSLTILGFLLTSHALPAPAPQQSSGVKPEASGANPVTSSASATSAPPSGPAGLRGSSDLLGIGGEPILDKNTAIVKDFQYVKGQKEDKDLGLYLDFTSVPNPQPIRGSHGGTDPGPRNYRYDAINSDLFTPPGTDSGDVAPAKWPMGLSHNRNGINNAGWARQQNVAVLNSAVAMAGVDMRLSPHAYRELHWHKANEWALIFNGSCRVQAVNDQGQTFVDDLNAGDVWFFPSGVPHSVQAFDQGVEFLLVFDDGNFSEENTFLASELFARNPQVVLAKNLKTDVSALDNIPQDQLWIFNGTAAPKDIGEQNITGSAGVIDKEHAYTYHFSNQEPYEVEGGSVKIIDPTTFPIAAKFSAALVTIKPGAMREVHWHLTSDEWSFFLAGNARITVFQAPESSRTFDFAAGDVAYIPVPESHYIENVGDTDVVVLEVLQAEKFTDMSMGQWLALTPPQIIKDTLNLPDDVIKNLSKNKPIIIMGSTDLTETNFTREG